MLKLKTEEEEKLRIFKTSLRVLPFLLVFLFDSSFLNYEKEKQSIQTGPVEPPFISASSAWVDSVFRSLSEEERIGQLFMIAAYSNKGEAHKNAVTHMIKKYKVGGLIFFQGGPVRQAQLTNYYQQVTQTPLLIAMDGEWGLSMRLDSTIKYPRQMMLGAIQDESLVYEMGEEFARQFKRLGVHINFAPVIDINNNARNPVINSRSFGESPINVTRKGLAYMLGMQHNGVIATAKHFPGHGDTDRDSHKTLPVIAHSRQRLDSIELFPFRYLISRGLGAVMTAHLHVPALDSSFNQASSLSNYIVSDLLKQEMSFQGLVVTDALGMSGVADYNQPGMTALRALKAGNDILLMSKDVPNAINKIKKAIARNEITQKTIDERCKKILKAKYWLRLNHFEPIETDSLIEDLNTEKAALIKRKLIADALTLLINKNDVIPIQNLDSLKIASVSVGDGYDTKFQQTLSLYDDVEHFTIHKNASYNEYESIIHKLSVYDYVIAGIHNTSPYPNSFGVSNASVSFIRRLSRQTKVLLTFFGNPYALSRFDVEKLHGLLLAYNDDTVTNELAAQLIYGGIPSRGRIPVTPSSYFPAGSGITQPHRIRLRYSLPLDVEMDSEKLKRIDTLALGAIEERATPGCQILVARNGTVFYHKSFGYHTYDKKKAVTNFDIYDLASVTKICATLPSLMKLTDRGVFDVNDYMSDYLSDLKKSNKKHIKVKDVLTHQARLKALIPFYLHTLIKDSLGHQVLDPEVYSHEYSEKYSHKVAENLYITNDYRDVMYEEIINSNLYRRKRYKYSDLGFYLFQQIIEEKTGQDLDNYVDKYFYQPLGATTLVYNPLEKFPKSLIVPTENDTLFRKQLVQGYVHDMGAAMLGGVAGHAGLFSNANDLAKLMQMYLQKGEYGGKRYIAGSTVDMFNTAPYRYRRNRRGLGFDKPHIHSNGRPVFKWLPLESFGHTGFTGTMVWVDPKYQLVYIFLSNRVYPDPENHKLISMNTRRNIQHVIYDAIIQDES